MEKLKMHSPNLTEENIAKIRDMFPGCVTEANDEAGKLRYAVDFDQLRQELSDHIVEGPQERYRLDWPGKREALVTANAPIAKTLRPCREESVNFDATKNLFIEGDNLDALKLLQQAYLGKVKMIYIDPPYNTGNDFVYDDNFKESASDYLARSNDVSKEGKRLVSNTSSNGRFHSDWLSFLYPRIKRAHDILSSSGCLLISIDDIEYKNVRAICDEIFGASNFVCSFIWKSRQIIDSRNKTRSSTDHEYIVAYARSIDKFAFRGKKIDADKYSNPDNDSRGPWMSNSILGLASASQRPNLHYPIVDPASNREFMCPPDSGWRYSRETMAEKIADERIIFPSKNDGRPREKKFQSELKSEFTGYSSVLTEKVGYTLNGSREVRDILGGKYFDFPKPTSLLRALIEQAAPEDEDIIMDFFAGSGTTAHAVWKLNSEDGKNRRVVIVQLPEVTDEKSDARQAGYQTISKISIDRLQKAGKSIVENKCHADWSGDVGFRLLRVDASNMSDTYYTPEETTQSQLLDAVDSVKPDRTNPEDLLFQVLVDWGVDLTLPIRKEKVKDKTVYYVNEAPYDLVACFDDGVTEEFVKKIAGQEPLRVVFRDNGFVSDSVKINVEQIFKQLSPATDIKSI